MVKTRKARAPARRRIQHGGVNNDSPLVEINIFLKPVKVFFDDNLMDEFNDIERDQIAQLEDELPNGISLKLDLKNNPNILPINMVRDMFARAQVNGVPLFSQIISAEWYDNIAPIDNNDVDGDMYDFGISVRVRTDLNNQEIQNYFQGYNLAIEHAAFEDNGWVLHITPNSDIVFARFYLLDDNDIDDDLGRVQILRGHFLDPVQIPQNIPQQPNIPVENNQNGGARHRKSKRKSRRVTRKKRSYGRR
jgi:hypothetical protein